MSTKLDIDNQLINDSAFSLNSRATLIKAREALDKFVRDPEDDALIRIAARAYLSLLTGEPSEEMVARATEAICIIVSGVPPCECVGDPLADMCKTMRTAAEEALTAALKGK